MPYGSITGAPKKRAIEVLERLELSPRGILGLAASSIGESR